MSGKQMSGPSAGYCAACAGQQNHQLQSAERISIEKNTKIVHTAPWADEVSADPKWNTRQLRLST